MMSLINSHCLTEVSQPFCQKNLKQSITQTHPIRNKSNDNAAEAFYANY